MPSRDLCETAYRCVDRDWRDNAVSDPALVRTLESGPALADASKARKQLAWEPTGSFDEMVKKMVAAQMLRLKNVAHITNPKG